MADPTAKAADVDPPAAVSQTNSDGQFVNANTPGPAADSQSALARPPPRKSALAHRGKNQKRTRATQEQRVILEKEFSKNASPTIAARERIAEDINMTERSVQIWFQNRRARMKSLAKENRQTGEDIETIPESTRAYLAHQAIKSGKGLLSGSYLDQAGLGPFGLSLPGGDQSSRGRVLIQHLTCVSLSIGKWARVAQNTMDLIIFYSPHRCMITYCINIEQGMFKMEYPFLHVKNISLQNNEGDPNKLDGIVVELSRPPSFFMDTSSTHGGFFQCGDFTEDTQASQCLIHHLGGNPKVLSGQLTKLVSLESFAHRHNVHRPPGICERPNTLNSLRACFKPYGEMHRGEKPLDISHMGGLAHIKDEPSDFDAQNQTGKAPALNQQNKLTINQDLWLLKAHSEPQPMEEGTKLTDSGPALESDLWYRSDLHQNGSSSMHHVERNVPGRGESDDDAQTSHSAVTSMAPTNARAYIHKFCGDVFGKLQSQIQGHRWRGMFSNVPNVIKAFAIKIGDNDSSQASRDIMFFIYKNYEEISLQLQDLFILEDEDRSVQESTCSAENMPLLEKMSMWGALNDRDDALLEPENLFQRARSDNYEEDSDITAQIGLESYQTLIQNSPAYEWLIATLQRDIALQTDTELHCIMTRDVRPKILRELPSRKLSRLRAPPVHQATFEFKLPSNWRKGTRIGEEIAITCLGQQAQVTTVEEYIKLIWPQCGLDVLRLLRMTIEHAACRDKRNSAQKARVFEAMLLGRTQISASIFLECLSVTVNGTAHDISECGELLAWLACALCSQHGGNFIHATPAIKIARPRSAAHFNVANASLASSSKQLRGKSTPPLSIYHGSRESPDGKCVTFTIEARAGSLSEELAFEESWERLFGNIQAPVFVHGYPTIRQPEASSGMEFTFNTLRHFANLHFVYQPSIYHRSTPSKISLQLAHRVDDIFCWHKITENKQTLPCGLRSGRGCLDESICDIDELALAESRHLVCECKDMSWQNNQDKSPMPVIVATSPTSGDIEQELCSISSSSERTRPLENECVGFRIFQKVFLRLLLLRQEPGKNDAGNKDVKTTGQGPTRCNPDHSAGTGGQIGSYKNQKRKRKDDGDDEHVMDSKRTKLSESGYQQRSRFLACPFWKKDPEKHWSCFLKKHDTIGHLKQHLHRRHTPEFYCQKCFIIFETTEICDNHILYSSCTRSVSAKLDGISHSQKNELFRKSRGSIDEQWYRVWGILFPGEERPASINVESFKSADLHWIREYSQREALTIFHDVLKTSGLVLRPEVNEAAIHSTIEIAMNSMFSDFCVGQVTLPKSAPSSTTSDQDSTGQSALQNTPSESIAKSGTAPGSVPSSGIREPHIPVAVLTHTTGNSQKQLMGRDQVTDKTLGAATQSNEMPTRGPNWPQLIDDHTSISSAAANSNTFPEYSDLNSSLGNKQETDYDKLLQDICEEHIGDWKNASL